MLSSMMNERTVEYTIVPKLLRSLSEHFGNVIPLFFWKSREGNRTSLAIHGGSRVRLIALFARRPKLSEDSGLIWGKINSEVRDFAYEAAQIGVLTIAGFVPANTLFDLGQPIAPFWIPLWESANPENCEEDMFFVDTSQQDPLLIGADLKPYPVVSLTDICEAANERCREMDWGRAIVAMSELRQNLHGHGFHSWLGGYKPVYFVIPA